MKKEPQLAAVPLEKGDDQSTQTLLKMARELTHGGMSLDEAIQQVSASNPELARASMRERYGDYNDAA